MIRKMEKEVLQEVEMIKSQQKIIYDNITNRIGALKDKIEQNVMSSKSNSKVEYKKHKSSKNIYLMINVNTEVFCLKIS